MKKEYIFNTILGILAAAKAIDANDHTALNFRGIDSSDNSAGFSTPKTSSIYANLDIEAPIDKDFEETMRGNIRNRLIKLSEDLDDNFPTKKKYAFNSGDPVGLVVLNPSDMDISRLTMAICTGEEGTDLSWIRKHHLNVAMDAINQAMQSNGIPLKLSLKPFTQPTDFYNPFNRPITRDQLMRPGQLASPGDQVWGSQALLFNVECQNIFGHPQALAETGDFYSFEDNSYLRQELSFKVAFFKRSIGLIGPGTIIHEIFHSIIKGHPHESMNFDPTNPYDMAILRTMCKPVDKLGSSMMYADECKKLPEFSENEYNNYWHDPKIVQVGIMEVFATKTKLNPDGLSKHLKQAEDLLYQEAKIQYQLIMSAQKQATTELEKIMKKDLESTLVSKIDIDTEEKTIPNQNNQYISKAVIGISTALALILVPAMLGYKKLKESQEKNRTAFIEEEEDKTQETLAPEQQPVPEKVESTSQTTSTATLTIGSLFGEVGSRIAQNIAKDFKEPYKNLGIAVQKLQKNATTRRLEESEQDSIAWQPIMNSEGQIDWEREVNRISELIQRNKIIPEDVNDGHRFSQDNEEDLFLGKNQISGVMYTIRYNNESQYPHVYAISPELQVNVPQDSITGQIMTFCASSQSDHMFIRYAPEETGALGGLRASSSTGLKFGQTKADIAIQNWQQQTHNELYQLPPDASGPLAVTPRGDQYAQGPGFIIVTAPYQGTVINIVLKEKDFREKRITEISLNDLRNAGTTNPIPIIVSKKELLTKETAKSQGIFKGRSS